jgi:heat shock protein HslJ
MPAVPSQRARLLPLTVAALALAGLVLAACGDDDFVAPPATTPAAPELEGPTWVLDVSSIDVEGAGDNLPTIRFLEGQVTGTTGCNSFRGTYTVNGSDLTLSPLATTLVGCPGPLEAVEREILDRLARVTNYEVASARLNLLDGDETVLLYDESKATIEGSWLTLSVLYDDAIRSVILDTELTAEFTAEGTVSGSGGCNRFTGEYTVTGDEISIGPLASTRMACESEEVSRQEAAYFAALESATTWEQTGNELILKNDAGQMAVTFQKD